MSTYIRFLFEFLDQLLGGILMGLKTLFFGILQMFDVRAYANLIKHYRADFSGGEWVLVILAIVVTIVVLLLIIFLVYLLIRKYLRFRSTMVEQESLLEELSELHAKVKELMKEKDELYAMKVSQLGLKPGDEAVLSDASAVPDENAEGEEEVINVDDTRFPKLCTIDEQFKDYKIQNYGNTFTLAELVEYFRNFAASELKLYYQSDLIKLFIASLASTKLVILQGISGTGKTSLAYAWGKFLKHDSCVASVQPSWRDRTELFGYFNEFTKKFNESNVLEELYVSRFDDDVHTIILDEMNIARVEYYFAEMLSILEVPNRNEWVIELVTTTWPDDPQLVENGKLRLPGNLWYIGTINNDDSTFMVTDKVYDRAMPIDINEKIDPFTCREQEAMDINSSYLEQLFADAREKYAVSEKGINIINKLDDYVIHHFRIAFGNRIMKQLKDFVPVYVACGGDEVSGIDYFLAKKVLRKFEQLNLILIRDEIDGFIKYLNKEFGNGNMKECIEFLERLKKSA